MYAIGNADTTERETYTDRDAYYADDTQYNQLDLIIEEVTQDQGQTKDPNQRTTVYVRYVYPIVPKTYRNCCKKFKSNNKLYNHI